MLWTRSNWQQFAINSPGSTGSVTTLFECKIFSSL